MSERVRAADDATAISARIQEIRQAETPMCPVHEGRTLYDCLRSSSRCSDSCEYHRDWIGPEG